MDLLLQEPAYAEMFDLIWEAVDTGSISILNPRARLYNEYPITYVPGVNGH